MIQPLQCYSRVLTEDNELISSRCDAYTITELVSVVKYRFTSASGFKLFRTEFQNVHMHVWLHCLSEKKNFFLIFYPCDLGDQNSANVCPCACSTNQLRDINDPIPPAYCMLGLLACSEAYGFGQCALRRMGLDSVHWLVLVPKQHP